MKAFGNIAMLLLILPALTFGQGNTGIFDGGNDDGFATGSIVVVASNSIFQGGGEDGFAIRDPQFAGNAGIYNGDSGDGFSELSLKIEVSNAIFSGGFSDGFDENMIVTSVNNRIYQGGFEDGFAIDDPNFMVNTIYDGLYYDGFAEASTRIECTLITWVGVKDSNWDNKDNWDIGRIPGACDIVIVDTAPNDPVIFDGSLGIEFFSINTIRRAKKLIVRPGGHLHLTEQAAIDVANEVRVSGILSSFETLLEPVVTLYEGGLLTIKPGGSVELE